MDQTKTGELIRSLRLEKGMTQLELAESIGVSDKAVSKWERGCGAPDISVLPVLSKILGADTEALLRGDMEENQMTNGNLKKARFYICPCCGNLLFSTDDAEISCCGKKLKAVTAQKADSGEQLKVSNSGGEWYISSEHEMSREHYISFVAFLTGDMLTIRKLYPEWGLDTTLPFFAHGTLLWYCTRHGLFYRYI